jgi:methionyl-tRNA formyltransferase
MASFGFFILGEKGFFSLSQAIDLLGEGLISFVVCTTDSGLDDDFFVKIRDLCSQHQIKFFTRKQYLLDNLNVKADYCFAIGWRWIISNSKNLIVFHDSLLPKYRGFAPLVNMLINGERHIGVTALIASEEYDKGDIVAQQSVEISYPIKIKNAITIISSVYAELLIKTMVSLSNGDVLKQKAQIEGDSSYSLWRDNDDYLINWLSDANSIARFCDAVGTPYKGAASYLNNQLIRILDASPYPDVDVVCRKDHIGKIVFFDAGLPVVVCGSGLLRLNSICDDDGVIIGNLPFRSKFKGISSK